MKAVAPAKINWTLEVLGRRDDGYHEIRSVMQTIDLCDEVTVEERGRTKEEEGWVRVGSAMLFVEGEHEVSEDDLSLRAVRALEEAVRRELPIAIRLAKRVPVAAGLGGGSSDAAAVMRCMNGLHGLCLSTDEIGRIGAGIGSDVPFFLRGGTAFAERRGERVTPLPDAPVAWLVLLVPPIKIAEKTKRMYQALDDRDFSDGARTGQLAARIRQVGNVRDEDVQNAFERVAYEVFEGLERYRGVLLSAGAQGVHLAGAGPALFAVADGEADAREIADRVQAAAAKVFVARTLGAAEATVVTD